jgi:hypothetical protein
VFNIAKQHNRYPSVRYRRLAARRAKKRAIVAIERALLTAIWHMLTTAPTTKIPDPTTTSNTTLRDSPDQSRLSQRRLNLVSRPQMLPTGRVKLNMRRCVQKRAKRAKVAARVRNKRPRQPSRTQAPSSWLSAGTGTVVVDSAIDAAACRNSPASSGPTSHCRL